MPGPTTPTANLQAAVIAAMSLTGNVTKSCEAAGIDRRNHYYWMKDPAYAAKIEEARTEAGDTLEEEAIRRAKDGYMRPIFQNGRQVGEEVVYSDLLLLNLLRGAKPQRYQSNAAVKLSGPNGGPVEIQYPQLKVLSDEELDQLRAIQLKLQSASVSGAGSGDTGEEEAED